MLKTIVKFYFIKQRKGKYNITSTSYKQLKIIACTTLIKPTYRYRQQKQMTYKFINSNIARYVNINVNVNVNINVSIVVRHEIVIYRNKQKMQEKNENNKTRFKEIKTTITTFQNVNERLR